MSRNTQNTRPTIQTALRAEGSGRGVEIHQSHYEAAMAGNYFNHFYVLKDAERFVARVSRGPWCEINCPKDDEEVDES